MDSPLTDLFARLSDLKLWQERQQERLTRRFDRDNEASVTDRNSFGDEPSKSDVILAQPKTFDQLLAEKLPQDVHKPVQVPTKPKKPFLKKGTGLLRYAGKGKNVAPKKKPITPLKTPSTALQSKLVQDSLSIENASAPHETADSAEQTPGDQTLYERELEKELLIFEELEKKVENSSFSSTNSSVVRLLFSSPDRRSVGKTNGNTNVEVHEKFDDFIDGLSQRTKLSDIMEADSISITSDELLNEASTKFNDEDKWSDSDQSSGNNNVIEYIEKCNVGTMTDEISNMRNDEQVDCSASEEILMKKLKELNDEIKTFRFQNEIVGKIRRDLDEEQRSFNKMRKALIKEMEDERFTVKQQLEEERKKLAKERMVFEKYVKDFKNRPSKKEREEISLLKSELENVREVLKCKETKNSMCQARLRNRIKSLETENADLQEEVEKLRKQNAKLSATAQRKSNDSTKVLHEINKNLTKLSRLKKPSVETVQQKQPSDVCIEDKTNDTSVNDESSDDDTTNACSPIRSYSHLRKITSEPSKQRDDNDNKENLIDISKSYEQTFKKFDEKQRPTTDLCEQILSDGSKEIKYRNGNVKKISPDGNLIQMSYSHGDFKETNLLEGTIKYYFKENQIWETTYADGTEVVTFPNGQIERKYKDGSSEVQFPNKVTKKTSADGSQEIIYPDGSVVYMRNGEKILLLPNGQKEIHTDQQMRREYPDGTVKIVYANGVQETKYANGRIRIKNKEGNLIMDSHG